MSEGSQSHASLERFLRLWVPVATAYALADAVAALVLRSVRVAGLTLGVAAIAAASLRFWRGARRGAPLEPMARVLGWLLLAYTPAAALLVPELAVLYVLLPVLAVALALPHLERRALGGFTVAALGAELSVAASAALLPPAGELPGWYVRLLVVTGLAAEAAVVLVLLASSRLALRERLAQVSRSEARFRSLVEATAAIVWTADPDGRMRDSPAWRAFTGQTVEESAGLGALAVVHPDDRAHALHAWREALAREEPLDVEYRVQRAGGGFAWLHARAVPVRGTDGRVLEWVGANADVTVQKLAGEWRRLLAGASAALAQSLELEETLERIVHLAVPRLADACFVRLFARAGPPVTLAHRDPVLEERLRAVLEGPVPRRELSFGSWHVERTGRSDLVADFDARALEELRRAYPELARWLEGSGPRSVLSVPLGARSGELLGALTLVTSGPGGRRLGSDDLEAAEELGRRCALALENALLYRRAQDAVRVREDFLAVASHELRTPLAALDMSLSALARAQAAGRPPDPRWLQERLERLKRHARRLERLVEALLDVSRIAGGRLRLELEEVDLAQLTRDTVARLADESAAGARVRERVRVLAPGAVVGRWDRLRLEQAVENLVGNALKYGEDRPVQVRVGRDAAFATLEVCDEGIGVPPEVQQRIFEKFERHASGSHYGGLGLGLYIVREVADALGGRVAVDSAPGRGATFTLRLPLAGPAARGPHEPPEQQAAGAPP